MKVPQMPLTFHEYYEQLDGEEKTEYMKKIFLTQNKPVDDQGRYAHWDKVQYRPLPDGVETHLEYWHRLKAARASSKKFTDFTDKKGEHFSYVEFDKLNQLKDWILENAAGVIDAPEQIKNKSTQSTYLINSLIEEAISSSKMEGASTTRRVAKDMLRSGRSPQDISEQMIFNNYKAMRFIKYLQEDGAIELTPEIIFELHKIVTEKTLTGADEGKAGVLRSKDDDIIVCDPKTDQILHIPPPSCDLNERLIKVCDFANGISDEEGTYLPPVLRAIITHFMMGYDHPFVEGNGRTARALFYWVMMKHNYWLMEYVSISTVIKEKQADYLRAYLHTESDENDLTYFILQQLEVIQTAIKRFHNHVTNQISRDLDVIAMFKASSIKQALNHRQVKLVRNALKNPGATYSISSHKNSHDCSKEVARRDLLNLSDDFGLLLKFKEGRSWVFMSPNDLEHRIKSYS